MYSEENTFPFQPCKVMSSTSFVCPTPDITEAMTESDEPHYQNCDFQVQHKDLQNNIQVRVPTKPSRLSKEQFLMMIMFVLQFKVVL